LHSHWDDARRVHASRAHQVGSQATLRAGEQLNAGSETFHLRRVPHDPWPLTHDGFLRACPLTGVDSLHLDIRVLDDPAVPGDVRLDERGSLLRAIVEGLGTQGVQLLLGIRPGHELPDLGGYLLDDGLRNPGRTAHTLPVRQGYRGQSLL